MAIGSDSKPPVLFRGDYAQWKFRFTDFILRQELGAEMLKSIEEGPAEYYVDIPGVPDAVPIVLPRREIQTDPSKLTEPQRNRLKADRLACSYLLQGLPNDIYNCIDSLLKLCGMRCLSRCKEQRREQGSK